MEIGKIEENLKKGNYKHLDANQLYLELMYLDDLKNEIIRRKD